MGSVVPATSALPSPASGTVDVAIQNFAFSFFSLTIQVGTTVRWTNQDSYPHMASSDNGVFESGTLNQG